MQASRGRAFLVRLLLPVFEVEARIRSRVEVGKQLVARAIPDEPSLETLDNDVDSWNTVNETLLSMIADTPTLANTYSQIRGVQVSAGHEENVQWAREAIDRRIAYLASVIERLPLFEEAQGLIPTVASGNRAAVSSRKVFVVHGHDEEAKQTIARFLERLDLEAVILAERAGRGRTLIEMLEQFADVGFAVVLLTPDDLGYAKDHPENVRPRARQNVILELGMFMGLLTRERVCALVKGPVEKPSDFDGVRYVQLDGEGGWQHELVGELKAAGLPIDANRLY